ncbi:unnamed protein product [Peniophora sp. CBMAI 1063]|nr:unnamed protein product [Peniophora sp. CBMAI 1063]
MPAHSTSHVSDSGWIQQGCPVCATGVSPATTDALPWANDMDSLPRAGQIWCIEESIFSPVATLLGQTMPAIMASSVTSFTDDRASKPRPCVITQEVSDGSYYVYLFGTFNGGKIYRLPKALQYFLVQVDPHASTRYPVTNYRRQKLPCLHTSPNWTHHPQFLVALPHRTLPGFGFRRVLNQLDRPWTNCEGHKHPPREKGPDCPTYEMVEPQRAALGTLHRDTLRSWLLKNKADRGILTHEFRIALDKKIEARARDTDSVRSFGQAGSDIASGRTERTDYTKPPTSRLRDVFNAVDQEVPAKEAAAQASTRAPSVSESSSGESESEPETPALPPAELPTPVIVGIERLTLDSLTESQPELADTPTPKRKAFGRHPAVPRSPTGSTRSFALSLLDRALRPTKNQAGPAKTAEDWPSLPTSPTTPTTSSRRHRRRDSRASKASTARGI